MGICTAIQYVDSTVNPTSGCDGCELWRPGKEGTCYARRIHETRFRGKPGYGETFGQVRLHPGRMGEAAAWSDLRGRPRPDKPWLDGLPRIIFIGDMSDVFCVPDGFRWEYHCAYLRDEIIGPVQSVKGRRHVWCVLTKRPHRMAEFAGWLEECGVGWPENLVAMTSVTDQKTADARIPALLKVPTRWHGVSAEPLWGPVDLSAWLYSDDDRARMDVQYLGPFDTAKVDWLIAGGESGPRARPSHPDWFRALRDDCQAAGVPFFFKQGSQANWPDFKNFDSFPPDLQIREVPNAEG